MYRVANQNIAQRTNVERAIDDTKIIGKNIWKVVRIIWIIITLIVMSFWIIAALMYLTGGEVTLG